MKLRSSLYVFTTLLSVSFSASAIDVISANVLCSPKALEIELSVGNKSAAKAQIPVKSTASFKSGKLKGCDAVHSKAKPQIKEVNSALLKNLKGARIVSISLPVSENGMEFDMDFDWITIQSQAGIWISGPVISAGGLENTVTNSIISMGPESISVLEESSSEGDTIETKSVYIKKDNKWQLQGK